jgi:hypothetical protein
MHEKIAPHLSFSLSSLKHAGINSTKAHISQKKLNNDKIKLNSNK